MKAEYMKQSNSKICKVIPSGIHVEDPLTHTTLILTNKIKDEKSNTNPQKNSPMR